MKLHDVFDCCYFVKMKFVTNTNKNCPKKTYISMIVPIICRTKSSKVVSGDVCPNVKLETHLFRKYKPKWKPSESAPQLGPFSLLNS